MGTGGVFSGPLDTPGTLQLLALMLVFGGVAMSYDLLFGYTGLLSFGHALYFAVGVYVVAIATTRWGWEFWQAVLLAAAIGLVLPLVLGTISLRVSGIAFAMVTLAFAEAGAILVRGNPNSWTGADEGVSVAYEKLPALVRRRLQHRQPLLGRARLRSRRLCDLHVGGRLVARAASGRRSAKTSCASRCSACARSRSS